MAGFGSQKRGTGRAVKKFSYGGTSMYASQYLTSPAYSVNEQFAQQYDPQGYTNLKIQAKSALPKEEKKEENKKEELAKGGMPPRNKKNFRSTKSGEVS